MTRGVELKYTAVQDLGFRASCPPLSPREDCSDEVGCTCVGRGLVGAYLI